MAEELERKGTPKRPGADFDDESEAESLRSARPTLSRNIGGQPSGGKFIAKHTVQASETLGSIALKYYQSAGQKFYMAIYEANKSTIGDNPNKIGVGMVLNIPEAPKD